MKICLGAGGTRCFRPNLDSLQKRTKVDAQTVGTYSVVDTHVKACLAYDTTWADVCSTSKWQQSRARCSPFVNAGCKARDEISRKKEWSQRFQSLVGHVQEVTCSPQSLLPVELT